MDSLFLWVKNGKVTVDVLGQLDLWISGSVVVCGWKIDEVDKGIHVWLTGYNNLIRGSIDLFLLWIGGA